MKKIVAIPFRINNSVAEFAVVENSIGIRQFIVGTANENETDKDAVMRIVLEQCGAVPNKWIHISDNIVKAFAFECDFSKSINAQWLEYENALEGLTFISDKNALTELFYMPQPL